VSGPRKAQGRRTALLASPSPSPGARAPALEALPRGATLRATLPLWGVKVRVLEVDVCPSGEGVFGEYDANNPTIYIQRGLPDTVYRDTLFHELVHCFWHLSGGRATLELIAPKKAEKLEEVTCRLFAPGLAMAHDAGAFER
jgi:Zn-dependent peptidase ImmA (M78 family)